MKKFYTLLALCLFGLVSMSAKDYYTLEGLSGSEYPSVDKFEVGVSYFIGNARLNERSFLCPTGATTALSSACLYQFEEAGTVKHKFTNDEGKEEEIIYTSYIIKNVETGQYLSNPTTYTASRSRAQEFTILPGEVFNAVEDGGYHVDWTSVKYNPLTATQDYDTNGNFILADPFIDGSKTCWVISLANSEETDEDGNAGAEYLSTYGGASFMGYRDTNCWAIYLPAKITGEAAMDAAFQDILGGVEFDPENFRIGSGPGEYSEEAVNGMIAAWEVFSELLNYGSQGDDSACDAAIAQLQEAYDALMASMGTLNDGQYYRFWNWRDNGNWGACMYEGNSQVKWTANYVAPEVLDIEGTHYIWKLVKIDGKNYFQNYYTGRYMSDAGSFSNAFPSTAEPVTSFTIEASDEAGSFNIRGDERSSGWGMHTQVNGYVVVYWNAGTSTNNQGSLWKVETIDPEQIAALEAELEQAHKNQQLSNLLGDATLTYKKGFAYDQYLTDLSQMTFNRTETGEGAEANIIDGDYNTYYHSFWSQQGDLGQPHWFQVAVEEPVQEFALDVVRRGINSNKNGAVVQWFVAGTNDATQADSDDYVEGDMAATVEQYKNAWEGCQVVNGEYNQSVVYKGANYDNAMATFNVNLGKPCKYIRFMAQLRMPDTVVYDTLSVDPLELGDIIEINYYDKPADNIYMCVGEVAMHSMEINPEISLINAVPADVRKALEDAMAKAQEELAAEAATDETYAALEKAYEDFLNNFPEPQVLKDLLEDAQGWLDEAPIGDEIGYFPEGATADLEKAIEEVGATVKDVMSMEEINAGKKALNDAIDALQAKLIYPEEGIYMIQSTTEGAAADNFVGNLWSGETQLVWGGNGEELEATSHPGYFWKLTKNADGTYSLFNYGTGNYLQAQPEETSPVGAAAEKSSFKLRSARLGGSFNLVFGENNFMNADPNGVIVTWGSAIGADNSSFAFVEASEEWSGDYGFYYEAGKPQIITLPFDVVNDCNEPLYKLVGTYEGAFQFDYYEDDAVIPAGTPVLYYSEDDSYSVDMFGTAAGELDKLTYTTEAKSQEGMFGTLVGYEKAPLGVGIFWGKKVVAAEDGDVINPNTGYLLRGTDCGREGELAIYYDSSVGTVEGIESAVVVKKSNNRGTFNLQGQKVSGKLPAGLYIINGHKVVVK